MIKKQFTLTPAVFVFVLICSSWAFCGEAYYIDNSRVLLYKVINWWYDCLPEESEALCARLVKYERRGGIIAEYNKKTLTLKAAGGFAAQLFVPDLKCTWSDKTYLGGGRPEDITGLQLAAGEVTIKNIDGHHYLRIQENLQVLAFELEGRIAGLANGRIALHRSGPLIKTCSLSPKDPEKSPAACFRILNFITKEVVATYAPGVSP